MKIEMMVRNDYRYDDDWDSFILNVSSQDLPEGSSHRSSCAGRWSLKPIPAKTMSVTGAEDVPVRLKKTSNLDATRS